MRSQKQLGLALGCVVYDMLMLVLAISMFRRHKQAIFYEGLPWGEPQIAIEVMLSKCRTLMEFLSSHPRHDDISVEDFGFQRIRLPAEMLEFRKSINQWSAHLSWQRALRNSAGASQPIQVEMYMNALTLLRMCHEMVEKSINTGINFTLGRHEKHYRLFKDQYLQICTVIEQERASILSPLNFMERIGLSSP